MNLSVESEDERSPSSALYLNFSFFKIDQKWRWLNDIGKEESSKGVFDINRSSEYENES